VTTGAPLRLGTGTGLELEYAIVDAASLDVRPLADRLLAAQAGTVVDEVAVGDVAWSNELALHVVELKTNGPVASLAGVAARFQEHVGRVEAHLAPLGARLMPAGMHPWMDPTREFVRWPHEQGPVYAAFDRIFDCRGHGWANLQACHLNLAFGDDGEFGRLHAAVRAVLPLLPALAAASPYLEGVATGWLDTRLDAYRSNARRVPSVSGQVVPEAVFTRAAYEGELLAGIYADLAPLDPEGILRHEWVNARGAIARFDRHALEIRLLDVQEHPAADVAIASLVSAVVLRLADGTLGPCAAQRALETAELAELLWRVAREGERALVDDAALLAALGLPAARPLPAGSLWAELRARVEADGADLAEHAPSLDLVLEQGPLARRMLRRAGPTPSHEALHGLARALCDCLAGGVPLDAPPSASPAG
jgi:gamma-glutamyl:cysteine ligase YbdK (ATP-grasp superfamily)